MLVNANRVMAVQTGGMLKTATDVGNLVVGLQAHRPVYLRDVATIVDGPGEIDKIHRLGFGPAHRGAHPPDYEIPAVTITVAKRSGANAVTVAD
ncbi:MAG: hypothetical protein AAB252_04740, partial [Pseudomonadota bacterium]